MRQRERRNHLNGLLALIATCVLFFVLFAHQVKSRYLSASTEPASYSADANGIRFVETEDGVKLAIFWGPVPNARLTVFYLPANHEDLGQVQDVLASYRLQGMNAMSFDYRGRGLSEGSATEKNTLRDAEAIYQHAVQELGVTAGSIVAHGKELGAAVAMHLAVKQELQGLVLETPFLSLMRLHLPLVWMPGDAFDNQANASKVDCPTLIIHGERDKVVPPSHGKKLAELIGEEQAKTLWLPAAGHDDLRDATGDRYWAAIRTFIASL